MDVRESSNAATPKEHRDYFRSEETYLDFADCFDSRRVRAKPGASKCNSHYGTQPSSAERRHGKHSISITVLVLHHPAVLVCVEGFTGQIVSPALRLIFIGIIALNKFRGVRRDWLRQRENLQQDFREPLRRPGWRAHLCYRRHRLQFLSRVVFF